MRRLNSGRFQKKPSASASNNDRIDGASVCVCVCVCAQGSDFEGDWLSVVICPTITVLYHNSGNFVTAPRTSTRLDVSSGVLMQEATTFTIFYDGTCLMYSFLYLRYAMDPGYFFVAHPVYKNYLFRSRTKIVAFITERTKMALQFLCLPFPGAHESNYQL